MHRTLRILAFALTFVLPVLVASGTASAQERVRQMAEPVREVGVELDTFAEEVRAAAEAAGAEAPSTEEIRERFQAADADGNGQLAAGEAHRGGDCRDRGVCVRGVCFCLSGQSGRLIEDEEANTAAQENPVFVAPEGATTNTIGH